LKISGELKGFAVFIKFALGRIFYVSEFFDFIIADRATGGFNESGINGNAFIDSQALGFKLTQDLCASGVFRN